jgi:hypothetical protein
VASGANPLLPRPAPYPARRRRSRLSARRARHQRVQLGRHAAIPAGQLTRNGYHFVVWKAGDLQYCAVSDTGWDELLGLVRLLQGLGGEDAR